MAAIMAGGVALPAQASATPPLTVTPTTTTRVTPSTTTTLTGLGVSGDTADTLQLTVATDLGTLSVSTTSGLTLAYGNSWTGTSSVTFTGSQANANAGLASVALVSGSSTGTAHVALTAMVSQTGYNYLAPNQHFYQYVANSGITWSAADTAAKATSFAGQPGYLATIPNSTVNSFISSKIADAQNVWFGARAYESIATDGSQSNATVSGTTYPRVWRWAVGASESPIAGAVVSECNAQLNGCSYTNRTNFYDSWASGEPNNSGGSTTVAYQGEYVAVTNWNGTSGAWNDLPNSSSNVNGYVVEYGGKTNNDPSLGTGFAGVVTATSNVLVAAAATVPGAPTISGVRGNASAYLTWNPPADGGSSITGYEVQVGAGGWAPITTSSSSSVVNGNVVTTVAATLTGLTNGTLYTIQIRADNAVGGGTASNSVAVTPATVPGAPTAVSATAGNTSTTVSFTAPASNGGTAVTGYTVTVSPGGTTASCSASPCAISGLTNGTAYTFTVHATNSVGNGAESASTTAVTPATVPGTPTGVVATRGDRSASVSFTAPASNGSAITGYQVTALPGGATTTCSSSPCIVTGLTNGTAYTFTLHAINQVGSGSESGASNSVTPLGVPGAPTGVSATAGAGSALVSFTAPGSTGGSSITGYTVTASPGSATLACSASPCVFGGLTNGTAYTFTVHSNNAVGAGPESVASSSVTPATVPGAPSAVVAVRGDGSASVSWSVPGSNGGASITGYTVTASGGATQACSASPCTVSGLSNGTAYTFTVHATNAVGSGPESGASTAVTPAGVPGAPSSLQATRGNGSASLSFGAATGNGSPVTGYQVSTDGGTQWTALATSGSTTLTAVVSGLTNGTSYAFRVRAVNDVGAGPAAGPQSTTPATVPDAPTALAGVRGDGQVSLSWTAPVDNGGAAVTGYAVSSTPSGHGCSTVSVTQCTITGLTNGTAYTFTVHATNSVGASVESAASASLTPVGVPDRPTGVSAVRGDNSAVVSFTGPAHDNGSSITGYTVTASPGGVSQVCPGTPCVILGLTNGTAYTFTVHASNALGDSPESAASDPVTPAGVPAAPGGVSVTRGDGSVSVSWDTPADHGASITGYTVTADPGGATQSCSVSPCVFTGLSNGTAYTFTVQATNAVGNSAESAPTSAVTPAAAPGVPTGVSAVRAAGAAVVSFTAPVSNGAEITGYTVTASPGGATATCSGSPCTVTGLTNGTDYTFTVHATNAVGDGAESAATSAVTPAAVPGAPTDVVATRVDAAVAVSWVAPVSAGGSPITGYTVTSTPDGQTCTTTGASQCTVTGLANGTAYTFTVHATNDVGDGPESAATSAVTPAAVPGAPTGVVATRGDGSASITWVDPADNGASITGYTVSADPGGATQSCSASPCVFTGLTNGTAYTFTVHASNAVGGGNESASSNPVTPARIPGAPTSLTEVPGDGQVTLTWTAPTDNGGWPISNYTVTGTPDGQTCSTTGATQCTVTGLTNGIAYTFTVHATNQVGAGSESATSDSVTPVGVPGAPSDVVAVRGDVSASVSWSAPASNGGAPITGYTVTAAPGGATKACSASPCVFTGLTNGTVYAFTVHATNAVGPGPESVASSSVTPATAPGAPSSVDATGGDASATISWVAPAEGGSAVTSYTVTADPGGASESCSGSPCVFTGLTNGTAYTFTVHATNAAGDSAESVATQSVTPAAAVPPATVPGAPTGAGAAGSDAAVEVSWVAPVSTGGAPITGYTVTADPGGVTQSCSASPCVFTGLTNGTAYTFTVHATNAAGDSAESAATQSVTPAAAVPPATVPGAPTGAGAAGSDAAVEVSWVAPVSTGGSITGYTVTGAPGGQTCTTTGATACTVSGLTNGTAYTFTVHATNAAGDSAESAATQSVTPAAAVPPATVPGAPTAVVATRGDASASISWVAPADGGVPITSYTVTADPGGVTQSCSASPCVFTGLTNGTAYTFTVHATNAAGDSAESVATQSVTPTAAVPPGAPTSLTVYRGDTYIRLSFEAPVDSGLIGAARRRAPAFDTEIVRMTSAAVTGYQVSLDSGATWSDLVTSGTSPITATVTGLQNGRQYSVEVRALNAAGPGPATGPATATPAGLPGKPTAVSAVRADGAATVTFTAPSGNGSPIIGYTIAVSPGGRIVPCSASPCVVTGLDNGTAYQFTVEAVNDVGGGATSTLTSPVTPQVGSAPGAEPTVVVHGTSATVSWTAPTLANGARITGYTVTAEPGGRTCTPTPALATSCTFDDLSAGDSYTFSVTVHSTAGDSRLGGGSAGATVPSPPTAGAPTPTTSTPAATGALPVATGSTDAPTGATTPALSGTGVPVLRLAITGSLLIMLGYVTLGFETLRGRRRRRRGLG